MTPDAPRRLGLGCGGILLIVLALVAIAASIYLYSTREERARRREKERAVAACSEKVVEEFRACVGKQGLSKDAGDKAFATEEFGECLEAQLDGWAACDEEFARLQNVFRLTESECKQRALVRERKCIGDQVLAGATAEQAKSVCGLAREAAFARCADPKSKDRR